jgi:hypothetical protein
LSAFSRQGRKGTDKQAVGSARPDSEARRINASIGRAILKQPGRPDVELENLLECMYSFADVIVQAFIERRSRSTEVSAFENVPEAAIQSHLLTSLTA